MNTAIRTVAPPLMIDDRLLEVTRTSGASTLAYSAREHADRPTEVRITIVYLCAGNPADVDNVVKPILDALVGLVIMDDLQVTDIDSHRRAVAEPLAATNLPPLLERGIATRQECVYVRVSDAQHLRSYL
jgi:hypothetical protein